MGEIMVLNRNSRTALRLAVSTFALAGLVPTVAYAQAEPQADTAAAEAPPAEDIVVTGTRLRSPDYQTASPTVSFSNQLQQRTGSVNLTTFLTSVPALVGSQTSRDNSGDRANIGTTGLNLLNLRNLGTDRTLVLVDGRRHVSGLDGTQSVDINTIPTDLIERTDILTGGASAVYGADAVTGVVNFVLKRNFEGLSVRGQAGISRYGDAGDRLFAATYGKNLGGGRGNIAIAFEHSEEDRLNGHERPTLSGTQAIGFYRNPDYDKNEPGSYSRIPLSDVRYQWSSRRGAVDVNGDGIPDFTGDGKPYNLGTEIPGGYTRGSDDTLASDYLNDLRPSIKRNVVNLIGHFDFSNAFKVYTEIKYAATKSFSLAQPTFDYYLPIAADNPYIPAAILAVTDPAAGVTVTRDNFDFGQRGENILRRTFRAVIGANGDLGSHLHYDASYVFGQTKVTNRFVNDRYNDRFAAALDAVRDPATGNITCRVNIDPSLAATAVTFKPGECLPINIFGEGKNAAANLAFIRADTTERTTIREHVATASISGDTGGFFNLPGGAVSFVVGGEYRKESSNFMPDPLEQVGATFSNLLLPSKGSFDVKEAFAELDLPVLKDRPFFKVLDFSAAARLSNYSSIGNTTTWKIDGNWAPISDIRFRGTISRAVRAPNIGELYGATSQTFAFFDDPCIVSNRDLGKPTRAANCQAILAQAGLSPEAIANFEDTRTVNIAGTQGGNPTLRPEVANTWTAGVVLQPSFIRGLQISFDWYNLRLKQAINTVDPQQLAELCVDQPTINNPFCSSIVRAQGTGLISDFSLSPQNVASFETAGLDINLDYAFSVKKVGQFNLKVVGNYLNKLKTVGTPGAEPTDDLGETPPASAYLSPKYQVFTNLAFTSGPVTLSYTWSWSDKTRRYTKDRYQNPSYVAPEYAFIKAHSEHDIYAAFAVNRQFEFYGGISNLFDQKPDLGLIAFPTEFVGRSFYAGFRARL